MVLPTSTTTAGIPRPNLDRQGRNAHLLPEIHARSKRILHQASKEMINANSSVVQKYVEVWKAKTTGGICTCTNKSIESNLESSKTGYLDLREFLTTKTLSPLPITESCPICYGTGIIGGYDLQGTSTVILDATNITSHNKVTIAQETPWWVQSSNNAKITWIITIPKYIIDIYGVVVKWKIEPKSWELTINGDPLTRELLLDNAGKRVSIELKMKDKTTEDAGLYAIVLLFSISNIVVNVDAPQWTKSFSGSLRVWGEIPESITANFDSRVNKITSRDIFIFEEGYIYRINQVEENRPLDVTVSWNCEAILVRPQSWYYTFPSKFALHNYVTKNITFVE